MSSIARLYDLLLHCYPSSYRREHQHELRRTFAGQTAHHSGVIGWLAAVAAAIGDVIPNALAVHADLTTRDVRQALRAMRRAPLLFGGALFVLAIGIGANGAVFSILQAVLLQPLPYREPERIGVLWQTYADRTIDSLTKSEGFSNADVQALRRSVLTPAMVTGWRDEARDVLADIATMESWQSTPEAHFDLVVGDHSERLRGAYVTPNFFDILGVPAALGRLITPADERENNLPIVISHALWQRLFGGDSSIIGRSLTLAAGRYAERTGTTFVVAGVLPRTFHFVYPDETEAWAIRPWSSVRTMPARALSFEAIARLAPGITMEVAQARVATLTSGLRRNADNPALNGIARLEPINDWIVGEARGSVLLLSGISLLLFVITCTTVANALFIRAATRKRELAVRAALGADHGRLVRQLFTEGLLLAVIGAILGSAVAALVTPVLRSFVPAALPRAGEMSASVWVVFFAIGSALLVVMIAVIAPAWRGSRVNLVAMLKRAPGTAFADKATSRWRAGLIGLQSAIATALLIIAVLLTASVWKLGHTSLGFDGERVLTFEMRVLTDKYKAEGAMAAMQAELMTRIRSTPGVLEAGLTSAVPFRGVDYQIRRGRVGDTLRVTGNNRVVDGGFFSVMHVGLVAGRTFTESDNAGSLPVVILSESYARKLFGTENPLGQLIDGKPQRTIVGVVRDVRYESLAFEPMSAMYTPAAQSPADLMCVVARTIGTVGPALRKAVAEIDPQLPVMRMTTIDQIISEKGATRQFYTTATIAFATLALMLTLAGLILIVARSVTERRHELAVRTALGATPSTLVRHVVRDGITPVAIGAATGTMAAFVGAGGIAPFLFQVSARSPMAYLAVATLILLTGSLATLIPAFRATRVHPANVLRAE